MTQEEREKAALYSKAIISGIHNGLEKDAIDLREMSHEDVMLFMHCLANIVPKTVHEHLAGGEKIDILDFNHIANRLVFQFTDRTE